MLPVRPVARDRAMWLGRKDSSRAVASTRSRVAGRTASGRENTRDTVALETPAFAATSAIVVTDTPFPSTSGTNRAAVRVFSAWAFADGRGFAPVRREVDCLAYR